MTVLPPFLVSTAWSVNSLTNERVLRVSEFGGILVALKMGQRSCCRGDVPQLEIVVLLKLWGRNGQRPLNSLV